MSSKAATIAALVLGPLLAEPALAASPCIVDGGFGDPNEPLIVTGTTGKQILELYLGSGGLGLFLDCNGDGDFTDAGDATLSLISDPAVIQLKGLDTITINQVADLIASKYLLHIELAGGANTVKLNGGGFSIVDSRIVVEVQGSPGADTLNLDFGGGTVNRSALSLKADLGAGNDVLRILHSPIPVSGGSFVVEALLGSGANTFVYDDGGVGSVGAGGTTELRVEGGSGVDTLTLNLGGVVGGFSGPDPGGRLIVNANLGGGNDRLVGNVDLGTGGLTIGLQGEAYINVSGGAGADSLILSGNGTTGPNQNAGLLDIRLSGGIGNDTLTVGFGAGGFEAMDGGNLRIRADGGAGSDTLTFNLDSSNSTAPSNYDVEVSGGAGNDVLAVTVNAGGSQPVTFKPGGLAHIDGSFGNLDKCTVSGISSSSLLKRNCEL